jgi:pyruvate-formate lyase-activating enzyme
MSSILTLLARRLRLLNDLRRNDGRLSVPYQSVMIEVTSHCNLDCPICPARRTENIMERTVKQIDPATFRHIVDLTQDMTESFCISMWGEPALHKSFLELVDYVSASGRKVWFSTNLNYSERIAEALAANPALHIICSVDGWDDETYKEYRWGGRFDVMKRNLAILARGKCTIYPQILMSDDDEERHRRFFDFIAEVVGTTERVIYKTKLENIRNDPAATVPGRCSSLYGGLYFNSDGVLVPCCTNVHKDLFLRHVSSYSAEELRNGAEVRELRSRILTDKNQFASCRGCGGEDQQKNIIAAIKDRVKSLVTGGRRNIDPARRG